MAGVLFPEIPSDEQNRKEGFGSEVLVVLTGPEYDTGRISVASLGALCII
jgi:hypothetical protein